MKFTQIALLFALGSAATVQAETFTVTRFDDPLPGACAVGDCSLREAAMAADDNDRFGPTDLITLSAGSYTLVRGELPLHQNLIVQGAGSSLTHVSTDARLLLGHDLSLDLRGLSARTSDFGLVAIGNNGTLALDDVATPVDAGIVQVFATESDFFVRNSDLRDGVGCNQKNGTCSIIDSQLSSLYVNPSDGPGPTVLLRGSVLDGALDVANSLTGMVLHQAARVEIVDSTITRTKVGLKDFHDPLIVRVRRLTYAENAAPMSFGRNGTLQNPADVEIIDSVFSSNTSRAIRAAGQSTMVIRGSSFLSNKVDDETGGAIVVEDSASMHVGNSTFSGNTFTIAAGQDGARGGAIGYRNGTGAEVDVQHVTIVRPVGVPIGVLGNAIGGYGGTGEVVVNISNTILAGTCGFDVGALHHAFGNIESPGNSCTFTGSSNQNNVSAANLAIGSLADHGGPTPTFVPADSSVAVDAASQDQCLALDQRGYVRPAGDVDAVCDSGAVEVGGEQPIFTDGFE
ncbi:MAG: choice-of-anchor Q domain-containing protein [Dokdonella sp.]|uniref:choice-of-anchor Q domain-containing protein n=1 Tax=Dokdonella sp. TaxID=2291710 RepID=UPI0032667B1B